MIIWGSRGDVINLGQGGTQHCEVCERERPFHYLLQYRYFHLYWVFGMVTQKQYLLLCDICNRGWKLNSGEVEKRLGKALPIPFMQRFGLLTLGAGFGALMVLGGTGIYGLVLMALVGGAVFFWNKRRNKA